MAQKTSVFAVLDLALARIVNGADCRPPLSRSGGRGGAIAQLGERVGCNDEAGGSIPPGSATLRPSGLAWPSHVMAKGRSVVPVVAHLAKDRLQPLTNLLPRSPRRPFFS